MRSRGSTSSCQLLATTLRSFRHPPCRNTSQGGGRAAALVGAPFHCVSHSPIESTDNRDTHKRESISNKEPSRFVTLSAAKDDNPASALFDSQHVLFEMDCPRGASLLTSHDHCSGSLVGEE